MIRQLREILPRVLLGAVLLVATAARTFASEPWPELPLPPRASVQWVGDSMRVNGVPMRIMQFQSSAAAHDIVEYYLAYWSRGYPAKPSVRPVGPATVVGQAHGPYFMTVKVRDADRGGSDGLIAVSRLLGTRIERSPGALSLMQGAKVLQVVESNDPGKTSRQMVISNTLAPPAVAQYYLSWFQSEGWQLVQHTDTPRTARAPESSFMVFQRDREEALVSVVAAAGARGSVMVANLVTKDTVPKPF